MTSGVKKTRMAWLPDGEKIEHTITRFEGIHECYGRTDGPTDGQTPHDGVGRGCTASRGNK